MRARSKLLAITSYDQCVELRACAQADQKHSLLRAVCGVRAVGLRACAPSWRRCLAAEDCSGGGHHGALVVETDDF
eukprot:4773429-Pleurochrysis_carterae.AAC.1